MGDGLKGCRRSTESGMPPVGDLAVQDAASMLKPRKTIDASATRAKLGDLAQTVRREDDADPFDEAMMAAVVGIVEAMKAEAGVLAELEVQMSNLGRMAGR